MAKNTIIRKIEKTVKNQYRKGIKTVYGDPKRTYLLGCAVGLFSGFIAAKAFNDVKSAFTDILEAENSVNDDYDDYDTPTNIAIVFINEYKQQ